MGLLFSFEEKERTKKNVSVSLGETVKIVTAFHFLIHFGWILDSKELEFSTQNT